MKHKMTSKMISIAIVLVILVSVCTTAVPARAESKEKTAMQAYVEAMQPGWNLGNTFDAAGDETSWGNPATTKALIDQIAAAGFKSIRLPITWKHRMGNAPDYIIDAQFMKRVQEVVDWALDAGLYVMINLHHDTGWVINMEKEHNDVLDRYKSAWTQISAHFKGYPNKLMFESINEPRFSEDWNKDSPTYFEMLDELNTSFYNIVRKSGGNNTKRPLVLPTITCSPSQNRLDELDKTIAKLKDNNIIATIHYYGYYPFSVNLAGATIFDDAAKGDLEKAFDRAYNTFAAKGIPVIIGEFGLLGFDKSLGTIEHGEILKFFEYITYYGRQKNLTLMLWDNGQHFNRRTLQWGDEALFHVMMEGLNGHRSSNAQTDSIYIKKDTAIQDAKIQLNPNENTLAEIKNGDKSLTKGIDYEINVGVLTIKSSLLQQLVTKQFGKNATLTCKFSAGADWNINVIYYDIPKLVKTEGTDTIFSIPTFFNGDSLATMEATYTSGGNAGPNNWTPFKEFNYTFSPSYDTNEIKLTKEFFKEVNDGEVNLKMHFWSGNVVEYTIKKDISKIVGLSSLDQADQSTKKETKTAAPASAQVKSADSKSSGSQNALKYSLFGIGTAVLLLIGIGIYIRRKRKEM